MNNSVLNAIKVKKLCYFVESFLNNRTKPFSKNAKTKM
jgi:hypothetical protein